MKNIGDIDPNLKVARVIDEPNVVWHSAADERFRIHGLYEPYIYSGDKPIYRRMPREVSKQVSKGVDDLCAHTTGGRIRFVTDSEFVAIHCECDFYSGMRHMPALGAAGFDVYVADGGKQRYVASFIPPFTMSSEPIAYESVVHFGYKKERDIIINFPLYNGVASLSIGLESGANARRSDGYGTALPVVFYGSSITQGGCASRPGNCYQGFISRALDTDYVNLGFSGNGKGEPEMARYIASLKMSAFVCDYDFNAPDVEHLKATHYALCKTVREANPELPIICVSKANSNSDDAYKRREVIRETVSRMSAEGDSNIYFVDGSKFYLGFGADSCTVDTVHPNDLGFFRMAEGLIPIISQVLGVERVDA